MKILRDIEMLSPKEQKDAQDLTKQLIQKRT